jgi:hypothetical protein
VPFEIRAFLVTLEMWNFGDVVGNVALNKGIFGDIGNVEFW